MERLLFLTVFMGGRVFGNHWQHHEILDPEGYFLLQWNSSKTTDGTIHFEVGVRTQGYVGLGLSPTGTMAGADLMIGWVTKNGTVYVQVRIFFLVFFSLNINFKVPFYTSL